MEIDNVNISFDQTSYNAIYRLFIQNEKGNWELIHELKPVDHGNSTSISIDLADTDLGSNILPKEDAGFNSVYHRFRVDVENSSGLINSKKKEFTI